MRARWVRPAVRRQQRRTALAALVFAAVVREAVAVQLLLVPREHGSSSSGHRRMPRRVRRLSDRDRPPSLYGLNAGIIDRTQFSLLVTVVVLSAIVPTAIAQRWFSPDVAAERAAATRRPIAAGERA
jgi:hypothetical protein